MANSGVSSDRAIYAPEGWTVDYSTRNENDLTAMKSGDLYYSNFFANKPQNTDGGNHTMWVRQRWGSSIITLFQEIRLPAGTYTLNADLLASDTSNGTCVFVNNQKKTVSAANKWETVSIEFTANSEETQRIGLQTTHTDANGERICGFDNFVLTQTATAISLNSQNNASVTGYYSLSGIRSSQPHKGVNIVRKSDGTVSKMIGK